MSTAEAIYFAKSMVRRTKEINHNIRPQKRMAVETIEFIVLMTLPFLVPVSIIYLSSIQL